MHAAPSLTRRNTQRWAGLLAATALLVTGCGDDDESATEAPPVTEPQTLAGTFSGTFATLTGAPKGTPQIDGAATMVVNPNATAVTIEATKLAPKARYVAHVHAQPCSVDAGGPHYMFDPNGPMEPPNEIWLTNFAVNKKGKGTAGTSVDRAVTAQAKSVVIHLKRAAGAKKDEAKAPKLACADLAPA